MQRKTICLLFLAILATFSLIEKAKSVAVPPTNQGNDLLSTTYGGAEGGSGERVKRSTSEKDKEPEWDPYKFKGLTMKYLRAGWEYVKEKAKTLVAKVVRRNNYILSLWKNAHNS